MSTLPTLILRDLLISGSRRLNEAGTTSNSGPHTLMTTIDSYLLMDIYRRLDSIGFLRTHTEGGRAKLSLTKTRL